MAVVLVAVVLIGIVIAGVFFGSSQAIPIGRSQLQAEQALAAAEQAVVQGAAVASPELVGLPIGGKLTRTATTQEAVTTTTVLTRTGRKTFWLTASATAGPNFRSLRRVGVVLEPVLPDLEPLAALTVLAPRGVALDELLAGSARIDGGDLQPPGWDECAPGGAAVAGVATDRMQGGTAVECETGPCIGGSPPLLVSSAVGDSVPFGLEEWVLLTSRATIRLAGGSRLGGPDHPLAPRIREGSCDTAVDHNWGDPSRESPCGSYFPVIHVTGDLHLRGGSGQGTLLVDGDLELSGGTEFVGAVFVRGALVTGAGGARLRGLTHVGGRSPRATVLSDGAELIFSRCAVISALAVAVPLRILPRSWIELH